MKNIHVLPTDKPSMLRYNLSNVLVLTKGYYNDYDKKDNQHIFITTDEEIKEGYVLNTFNNTVYKIVPDNSSRELLSNPTILPLCAINREHYFKIILTTDQDLINDGVQAIPDDFLEWFVHNPSCEWVKVKKVFDEDWSEISGAFEISYYKIIIPKEEVYQVKGGNDIVFPSSTTIGFPKPKQETLEEAAEKWVFETNGHKWSNNDNTAGDNYGSFIAGAKWQAERMYSEEEVKELILDAINSCTDGMSSHNQDFKEWFEENKKK